MTWISYDHIIIVDSPTFDAYALNGRQMNIEEKVGLTSGFGFGGILESW